MSEPKARLFEDSEAKRGSVPLLISNIGPTGGGKTESSMLTAVGIQRVTGGDIYVIDTESRRALHYADKYKFRHVDFRAPFGPLDYLAAIEHCYKKGAKIVIVDSMSHEHDGPGGVLEMHQAEVDRLSKGDDAKAERVKMLAWGKPKADRRRMINTILQLPISTIFCFRAKEKIKIVPGKEPKALGFVAIAGEEFLYEMTVSFLLLPGAKGKPTWHSDEIGERAMMKLPGYFEHIFSNPEQLSAVHGEKMALWAQGDDSDAFKAAILDLESAPNLDALKSVLDKHWASKDWSASERGRIKNASMARKAALEKGAP